MGNQSSAFGEESVDEPSQIELVFNNYLILKNLISCLGIKDLLSLRQLNVTCDNLVCQRLRKLGASIKELKSDEEIDKLVSVMANGFHPLPFLTFSLDVTKISIDGIAKLLEIKEAILHLSIFYSRQPNETLELLTAQQIRMIYVNQMVGLKIGRILTAICKTLLTLRLKFFADVRLVGEEESSPFPLELEALETLEGVYFQADDADDLMSLLTHRAGNLDNLQVKKFSFNCTADVINRIPRLLFSRERKIPPSLSISTDIYVRVVDTLQELVDRGYNRLRALNLGIYNFNRDQQMHPAWCEALFQSLTNLLQLQMDSLEDLLIDTFETGQIQETGINVQIVLPLLKKLERLVLYFPQKGATVLSPVAPIVTGQFPKLAEVALGSDHGWFNDEIFPTVTSLQVNFERQMSDHHKSFPRLKKLIFYGQDPSTFVSKIFKQKGEEIEVLGCFGLSNRVATYSNDFLFRDHECLQQGKMMMRVPHGHLLGNVYRFDNRLPKGRLVKVKRPVWQCWGVPLETVSKFPNLKQLDISILTMGEFEKINALCCVGDIPGLKLFRVWTLPTDINSELPAFPSTLGRFHGQVCYIKCTI